MSRSLLTAPEQNAQVVGAGQVGALGCPCPHCPPEAEPKTPEPHTWQGWEENASEDMSWEGKDSGFAPETWVQILPGPLPKQVAPSMLGGHGWEVEASLQLCTSSYTQAQTPALSPGPCSQYAWAHHLPSEPQIPHL
jgi:hypothetical protein